METEIQQLAARVGLLEARLRRSRRFAAVAGVAAGVLLLTAAIRQSPPPASREITRTKVLIIEDEQGRDRIVLGAPMPDPRNYVGMKILDPDGQEQFGLSLAEDGAVGMGFDVRPGVGNPANRERLNMGVDPEGHGWIRFLDNETRARLLLMTDSTERGLAAFLDWSPGDRITAREYDFEGSELTDWTR